MVLAYGSAVKPISTFNPKGVAPWYRDVEIVELLRILYPSMAHSLNKDGETPEYVARYMEVDNALLKSLIVRGVHTHRR